MSDTFLPTHGRYLYAPWPGRARWSWPNGAKLALYLGVNLEHFAFGEGLGAELAPGGTEVTGRPIQTSGQSPPVIGRAEVTGQPTQTSGQSPPVIGRAEVTNRPTQTSGQSPPVIGRAEVTGQPTQTSGQSPSVIGRPPDVLNYAWRDYGNRVGGWRLLELLDELALPATVLLNTALYGYAPALVAAHRARGDEMAGHGRTNAERQSVLDEAGERALIAESTAAMARHEGQAPRGWLSPWIAESRATPDLLREAGYAYTLNWCMDDQPVWLATRAGRLLAIPYPQEANDIPAIIGRKDGAVQFADLLREDFSERLDQVSRDGIPQVMGVALHPYIVGQPYRLRALRRALGAMLERRDEIWVTTAGGILDHVLTLPDGSIR